MGQGCAGRLDFTQAVSSWSLGINQVGDQRTSTVPRGHHQLAIQSNKVWRIILFSTELEVAEACDVQPVLPIQAASCNSHLPISTDIRLVGLVRDGVVGESHHPLHRAG